MKMKNNIHSHIFTSESVSEGHPDKVADQISDAVLDACLKKDPNARVACETFATTGTVTVMGEITTSGYVDMQKTARETIRRIGYTGGRTGFDADKKSTDVRRQMAAAEAAQKVEEAPKEANTDIDDILSMLNKR